MFIHVQLSALYFLVGGLEHEFYFFHILGIILPFDKLHHFSRWLNLTINQIYFVYVHIKPAMFSVGNFNGLVLVGKSQKNGNQSYFP